MTKKKVKVVIPDMDDLVTPESLAAEQNGHASDKLKLSDVALPFKVRVPDSNQPGFLRRLRSIVRFQEIFKPGTPIKLPDLLDLISFIQSYIEPATPMTDEELTDLVMDLSEREFLATLDKIGGEGADTVPPEKSDS